MKILSKYKDYYDYYQGIFGTDTSKIYDRRDIIKMDSMLQYDNMKKLKLILVVFIMVLMTSCDVLQVTATGGYDINEYPYNYNRIDRAYRQNPQYFYDSYYIDSYGNMIYYNNHPYFLRYQQDYYKIYNHAPLKYYGYDDERLKRRRSNTNAHPRKRTHVEQPIQRVQPQRDNIGNRTYTQPRKEANSTITPPIKSNKRGTTHRRDN